MMRHYVIKKGRHYCRHGLGLFYGKTYDKYLFNFDKTCLYDKRNSDDLDLNKLLGWSYGWHMRNSIRIGWRTGAVSGPIGVGKIELFFYMYNKGHRLSGPLAEVEAGEWYIMEVEVLEAYNCVGFTLRTADGGLICKTAETFVVPGFVLGYGLYPYFGGNNTAPHDMGVWVNAGA